MFVFPHIHHSRIYEQKVYTANERKKKKITHARLSRAQLVDARCTTTYIASGPACAQSASSLLHIRADLRRRSVTRVYIYV